MSPKCSITLYLESLQGTERERNSVRENVSEGEREKAEDVVCEKEK